MALMARAYSQAQKFGVDFAIPAEAIQLAPMLGTEGLVSLKLQDDQALRARSVVLATGARYRRLDVENLADFEATSVHYWASPAEVRLCAGEEVALVGGGNSAGQAAVYLAGHASKVWLLVRGSRLASSMSRYLVDRIESIGNIELVTEAEVVSLEGSDGRLSAISWRLKGIMDVRREIRHLFLFIGADPNTDWLSGSGVALDNKGFVLTGSDFENGRRTLETSRDRIFCIGDARFASTKRVAAAVGEGAQVVANLHLALAT
jgi:thioredoxin reductase (NADPH)